jgi:uncharacterized membrane protein YphA (DoxX/SURF4 family)
MNTFTTHHPLSHRLTAPVLSKTRLLTRIILALTGSIFIFSGLIKLNDPVGTKIKLEEYFEVFAADLPAIAGFFHALMPLALTFSVILCVMEVVLGLALLLRYRLQKTLWVLLGLVLFFTFLTFYSAYFNKVTDCGCFGDAFKLKPWQSFSKDVVLLLATVYLLWQRKKIYTAMSFRHGTVWLGLAMLVCVGLGVGAILLLPPVDFLPYREGNNITELRQPSAPFRYKYIMEKNGQLLEFEEYPKDTTLIYKNMLLLNPEAEPKIKDYALWNQADDFTEKSLQGNKLFIVIQDFAAAGDGNLKKIAAFAKTLKSAGPVIITSSDEATTEVYRHEYQLSIPVFFADATVLKTMLRTNPGFLLLQNGIVKKKWAPALMPDATEVGKYVAP